jgi:hypothetical protein
MGSSSSSVVNQTYDTTIVNKSDIDILNKNINKSTTNTVVKTAASCSANTYQSQLLDFSKMKIAGNLDIGDAEQNQTAALSFSCVQESDYQNNLANNMKTAYVTALKTGFSTQAKDKISANAAAASKTEFATTGSSHSSSDVNVNYKFNQDNITDKNVQNVVENIITHNLNISNVQKCASSINNSQQMTFAGTTVGGSVKIGILDQNQAADLMSKCVQKTRNSNTVTSELATALGITVREENDVKKQTSISSKAKSEAKDVGVFQSMGQGVGDVFKGIGGMFGGIFSGLFGSPITCLIICCCLCIVILGGGYMFMNMGGYETGEDMDGGCGFIFNSLSSDKFSNWSSTGLSDW